MLASTSTRKRVLRAGVVSAVTVLDFLLEQLNELVEHWGEVYVELTVLLYQELMLLGVINFVIFLEVGGSSTTRRKCSTRSSTPTVMFYLGTGLLIQGAVLASSTRRSRCSGSSA